MPKRFFLLLLASLLLCPCLLLAQGPNGTGIYYKPANGKTGAELKTAMHLIIKNPKVVGYGGLKEAYMKTDVRPDGYLRDWYSNATQYEPGSNFSTATKEEGLGYNREHLLPQSWFGKKIDPMYSDITHVVPTDGRLNSLRNDNPLGDVTDQEAQVQTSKNGYSRWGAPHKDLGVPEGLTKVFEPNDSIKGDIARIYFYMITCYEDTLHSWPWRDSRTATYVFDEEGTPYEPLQQWVMTMFMRWSEEDPVDSIELARNEAVFRVQGNRNPYVDYPGLEQYVWGELRDEPLIYGDGSEEDDDVPVAGEVTLALNSQFFGGEWLGSRPALGSSVVRGSQDGITVEYALGNEGRNMYLAKDHIRLYQKNLLVFSTTEGTFEEMTFEVTKNDAGKILGADEGEMDGYHWTGSTPQVTFQLDDGNGVFYLASVTVRRADTETESIYDIAADERQLNSQVVYDLQGRRIRTSLTNSEKVNYGLQRGLYIINGKKVLVK